MNNKIIKILIFSLFGILASGCGEKSETIEKEEARKKFYKFDPNLNPEW